MRWKCSYLYLLSGEKIAQCVIFRELAKILKFRKWQNLIWVEVGCILSHCASLWRSDISFDAQWTITPPAPPPPTHSVLFRVRICSFPPFESTPLSPDWQNFWTPLSRAFRRLFASKNPPKSRTLLNVPPIFYFITPFLNFSGVQREIERERQRKTTPF